MATRRAIRWFIVGLTVTLLLSGGVALFVWIQHRQPEPGTVRDEALRGGRTAPDFAAADEDYFKDMDRVASPDGPIPASLTPDEVKGRNTWLVWTAGNDRMWDELSVTSFGGLDLLKTLSTHDSLGYGRQNRWQHFGLVNEPCFDASSAFDDGYRFGLRLDRRQTTPGCGDDPFENADKYPGVRVGARTSPTLRWRGKDVEFGAGSYYGYATGVVGLRLFPNPDFDQAAADRWDPERYYTDPSYYNTAALVRPYRVGMSCALCHVGPNPINPPPDPNAPGWEHLSSNVGAQYFWVDRVLYWRHRPDDFAFQLFHASRPGTLDTSFISSDNINNPRSMNAVYLLGPRLAIATRTGREQLTGGGLDNRQFNDVVSSGPLTRFFETPGTVFTPRVLKDGADSVGALGALNRVFINIGTFSEEWLLHFNPLVGGKPVTPIPIRTAREQSAYFAATEHQTPAVAMFFLKTTGAHRLKDAPGGSAFLTESSAQVARGREIFAGTCARCHSSKAPPPPPHVLPPDRCNGKNYLECWNAYWAWTETPAFKEQMRSIVLATDFLDDNYLSSELRVPVTLLQTNACSPLATNAIRGNIWDNFSSQSYKELPSVGAITWYHPVTGEARSYTMPAGGRGYTRPPSLVSLWSTAPFLLNNTVGPFEPSPSIEARMRSFQASIEELLWPERRAKDSNPRVASAVRGPSLIDRVGDRLPAGDRERSVSITAAASFLPPSLQSLAGIGARLFPRVFNEDGIGLGPIPPGTPIGLISNLILLPEGDDAAARDAHMDRVRSFLRRFIRRPLDLSGSTPESIDTIDELLGLSKCPDLIVNRGHYFGSALPDADKRALIGFLKTF
jgi:hypothetical protein